MAMPLEDSLIYKPSLTNPFGVLPNMPSLSQLFIAFIVTAAFVVGEGETESPTDKPSATGYSYDVSHRNLGQWQPQYGYQAQGTGFRAGSTWPYNQGQYNAYGNKNWNNGQYSTYSTPVPAYGNMYSTFGTTGYSQGNPAVPYNPAYGNQGIPYNPAYGTQGTAYNPALGSRYQGNPAYNRPIGAYGSRTPNNPYNTPWLNAYGGQAPGINNGYGAAGYRNVGYPYNTAGSIPSTLATTTPKYNTFGSPGYSAGYNPAAFGTGYGYNSVGFGATGQDYNAKYSAGSKQWADGRYTGTNTGEYGSQSFAKPWYQNQFTSPTYAAPTNTAYGK